jgi:hypothetical protein
MGAVGLEASVHLANRASRYTRLFEGDGWYTGEGAADAPSDREVLERAVRAFEDTVLDSLEERPRCQRLRDLRRIAILLKMMEWPGPPEVATRPMQLAGFRHRRVLPDPSEVSGSPLTGTFERAGGGPQPGLPGPPPRDVRVGAEIVAVVLAEKTNRGGWKVRIEPAGLVGIFHPQSKHPADLEVGRRIRAKVMSVGGTPQLTWVGYAE